MEPAARPYWSATGGGLGCATASPSCSALCYCYGRRRDLASHEKFEAEAAVAAAQTAFSGNDHDRLTKATERMSQAVIRIDKATYKAASHTGGLRRLWQPDGSGQVRRPAVGQAGYEGCRRAIRGCNLKLGRLGPIIKQPHRFLVYAVGWCSSILRGTCRGGC